MKSKISDFESQLCCGVTTFGCERLNTLSVCFLCSFSFEKSLKLLGLDDSFQEGTSDPVVTRGAYLSLIHLRHLKLRQLQVKSKQLRSTTQRWFRRLSHFPRPQRVSLGLLNYLRSVERTLTFDLAGLRQEGGELRSTAEETGRMNAARGGSGEAGGLGSLQFSHNTPVDYKVQTNAIRPETC